MIPTARTDAATRSILTNAEHYRALVAKAVAMTVKTFIGTMGIHGTIPRVEIMDDGGVEILDAGRWAPRAGPRRAVPLQRCAALARSAVPRRPLSARQEQAYDQFFQNRPAGFRSFVEGLSSSADVEERSSRAFVGQHRPSVAGGMGRIPSSRSASRSDSPPSACYSPRRWISLRRESEIDQSRPMQRRLRHLA